MKITSMRDGQGRILGNITRFSNGDVVARDRSGRILGRSSRQFGNTRDSKDQIVSNNTADARILFRR